MIFLHLCWTLSKFSLSRVERYCSFGLPCLASFKSLLERPALICVSDLRASGAKPTTVLVQKGPPIQSFVCVALKWLILLSGSCNWPHQTDRTGEEKMHRDLSQLMNFSPQGVQ